MQNRFERIRNANVSVREVDGSIVFLRKLLEGGSNHSFGIHVARLAGMPRTLTHRAEEVLAQLEASRGGAGDAAVDRPKLAVADAAPAGYGENSEGMQLSFFQLDDPVLAQVRDTILSINIDHLTPVEALLKLHEIRKAVGGN